MLMIRKLLLQSWPSADTVKIDQVIDYTKFSQCSLLIRTAALVLRFIKACRKQRNEDCKLELTVTELDNTERC